MGIVTADAALYERLARGLALWGEDMCLTVRVGDALQSPDGDWQLLFPDLRGPCGGMVIPEKAVVIAVAGDDRQAAAAFRLRAAALLSPSFTWEDLRGAMCAGFDGWQSGVRWLGSGLSALPLFRIRCVEAAGRHSVLYSTDRRVVLRMRFSLLLRELPSPPFLRCQRSYIVHPAAVEGIRNDRLALRDGSTVTLSRQSAADCAAALLAWRREREEL